MILLKNKKIKTHISVFQVATVQGLSGTGSLRLAAALIERYFPGAKVLISSPTWGVYCHSLEIVCEKFLKVLTLHGEQNCFAGNHKNIFNDARVPWSEYRYYDPKTVGLDFEGMIADIKVPSWLSCTRFSLSFKLLAAFILM